VIPRASVDQIPNLLHLFQTSASTRLLAAPALAGTSSLKEMLVASRLDDTQQTKLAQLYAANRSDLPAFWRAVGADRTLGPDTAARLQVNGKLGFLTINNAPLMQKIHAAAGTAGLTDPLQLAQMGYHRADSWTRLLTSDVPLPNEIPGSTPDAKRANYAAYLAAQVRLSYPTACVAQMVKSGTLPLTKAPAGASDRVHAFLTAQQGKFAIGVEPVERYLARNQVPLDPETVRQVKRLQRVYQITPSDDSLIGLMKRGIDSPPASPASTGTRSSGSSPATWAELIRPGSSTIDPCSSMERFSMWRLATCTRGRRRRSAPTARLACSTPPRRTPQTSSRPRTWKRSSGRWTSAPAIIAARS
jgi:hypothetical protein